MLIVRLRPPLPIFLLLLTITLATQAAIAQQCRQCDEYWECRNGYAWDADLCRCVQTSPIIIDITGGGVKLTDAAHGVTFDINGDGVKERIAWTQGSSSTAFLVLDRNHNGAIDDGTETLR